MNKFRYLEQYDKEKELDEIKARHNGYEITDYDKWKKNQRIMQWSIFAIIVFYVVAAYFVGLTLGYNSAWEDSVIRADGVCNAIIEGAKTVITNG